MITPTLKVSLEVPQMVTSYHLAVNLLFYHKIYLVVLVDFIVHSPQRNNYIFLTQSKVTQDIILETIDAYYNVLLAKDSSIK